VAYLLQQILWNEIPNSILGISNAIGAKLCIGAVAILTHNVPHTDIGIGRNLHTTKKSTHHSAIDSTNEFSVSTRLR
jgi:hypothetical protein